MPSGLYPVDFQRAGDLPFASAGQSDQSRRATLQLLEAQQAFALRRLMLRLSDQPAEVLPAGLIRDQQG